MKRAVADPISDPYNYDLDPGEGYPSGEGDAYTPNYDSRKRKLPQRKDRKR